MSDMFPMLSFEQANPVLSGFGAVQDINSKAMQQQYMQLLNSRMGAQNQYLPQMLQQELLKSQLSNQLSQGTLQPNISMAQQQSALLTPQAKAAMALQGAQAGYYGSEANKNKFMVNHPAFMAGGSAAQLAAIDELMKSNPNLFSSPGAQAPSAQPGAQSPAQMPPQSLFSLMGQQQGAPNAQQGPLPGLGGAPMPQQMPPNIAQLQNQQGAQGAPASPSPFQGLGGAPGQPQDIKSALINSMLSQMQLPASKAQLYEQKLRAATYLNSTPDTKRYSTAQATAFGYSPDDAVKNFMGGKSVEDLAKEKGYGTDPLKWPTPDYNPTIATLSRNQQRATAISELNAVEPFINNALGQYSQTIHGYSPSQVMDSFNSLNNNTPEGQGKKDKLSDFLAATIVVPEYNAIRARAMGVQNIGVEAMRGIGDASMNNFKKFQGLVPSDVYVQAQTKANQLIKQMNSAATKASLVTFQQGGDQGGGSAGAPQASPGQSNMVRVQAPNGQVLQVPEANVGALLKDYPDHKRMG